MINTLAAWAVTTFARLVTGVRPQWHGCAPEPSRRIYFANHRSHGDFVLVWAVLPPALRRLARPVAGADYWLKSAARRFIVKHMFRAVLIDRDPAARRVEPVSQMGEALGEGASLILFPEGTRNTSDEPLLPFKSGLYHLAKACPDVDLVPTWIENLNRVLPKGEVVPVPLLCTVTFGAPLRLAAGEERHVFCERSRAALLATARTGRVGR